jgi:hypothetical protein
MDGLCFRRRNPNSGLELCDPASGSWTVISGLAPNAIETATLLLNGNVLVAGGDWSQKRYDVGLGFSNNGSRKSQPLTPAAQVQLTGRPRDLASIWW